MSALTLKAIRAATPGKKVIKLFDGGGLFLLVTPNGGTWWRLKYRFDGKEKLLSLGTFPNVSLNQARDLRHEARKKIAQGIDPSAERKAIRAARSVDEQRAENSFEVVAREWLAKFSSNWVDTYAVKVEGRLAKYIFPHIGSQPIADIKPPDVLDALRRIEARGAIESARRALSECSQVFRYGVATGRVESDPTRDLRGALATPIVRHMPAITDPRRIGELMRAIAGYDGTPIGQAALKLAPLLFVRPGELRKAEWAEIDLDAALWTIPAARMKTRKQNPQDHIVPLSTQAVEILRELHKITWQSKYVFHGDRSVDRPMSENTVNAALRRLGYSGSEIVGHGFRAMARTLLDEVLGFRPDIVEQQLAHAVRDPQGRAYNRTAHLDERRRMMQKWSDYLDSLAAGASVLAMKKV